MQEYSLKRSFSEKLEKKKHMNLTSFFAVTPKQEKYQLISRKLGEHKTRTNLNSRKPEGIKKNFLENKEKKKFEYKTKKDLFELKLTNIDKEILNMIQENSSEVQNKGFVCENRNPSISPVPKPQFYQKKLKRIQRPALRSVNTKNTEETPNKSQGSIPIFFTPQMIKSSVKRLKTTPKILSLYSCN